MALVAQCDRRRNDRLNLCNGWDALARDNPHPPCSYSFHVSQSRTLITELWAIRRQLSGQIGARGYAGTRVLVDNTHKHWLS